MIHGLHLSPHHVLHVALRMACLRFYVHVWVWGLERHGCSRGWGRVAMSVVGWRIRALELCSDAWGERETPVRRSILEHMKPPTPTRCGRGP